MAGTISHVDVALAAYLGKVSMESGLDGRNNSGRRPAGTPTCMLVSMESGLDGRNNRRITTPPEPERHRLNGVRPRWPEQLQARIPYVRTTEVSQWSPA